MPAPQAAAPATGSPTRDLTVGTAMQRVGSYPGQVDRAIEEQSK